MLLRLRILLVLYCSGEGRGEVTVNGACVVVYSWFFSSFCFIAACFEPFGIEDGVIPDKAITSSSSFGPGFEPFHGRLNGVSGNGSWCALKTTDKAPYLQIDLGSRFQVSMIAIQGNPIYEFVTVLKKRVNCRYVFSPNHRFTIVCLCGHSLLWILNFVVNCYMYSWNQKRSSYHVQSQQT